MKKEKIITFTNFDKNKKSSFRRINENLEEEKEETQEVEENDEDTKVEDYFKVTKEEYPISIDGNAITYEEPKKEEILQDDEESLIEPEEEPEDDSEEERIEEEPEEEDDSNYYIVHKDKNQDFSCDISLEGADLNKTSARLILETNDWNLVFFGSVDKNGKCLIEIKKLSIFNEGVSGKIKLEIIAEDSIFTPWEKDFKVKVSKKVNVKIHESNNNRNKPSNKKSVKVKVRGI